MGLKLQNIIILYYISNLLLLKTIMLYTDFNKQKNKLL
jgi:hypothetical protein